MKTAKTNPIIATEKVPDQYGFFTKLKIKWGATSIFQIIATLAAFSLAGSTVVLIRPMFFSWLGYTDQTSFLLKTVTYILFIIPTYQILLLIYGSLLGQFSFFWQKEQRFVKRISSIFSNSKKH